MAFGKLCDMLKVLGHSNVKYYRYQVQYRKGLTLKRSNNTALKREDGRNLARRIKYFSYYFKVVT